MSFTNATASEVRAANFELDRVNTLREAQGESGFVNIKEMIVDRILTAWIPEWIEREANAKRQETDVRALWRDATNAERAAAILILTSGV